ncbi:MAG: hypothetical protein IAB19_03010 [Proteobacteria bacterium]|uniref:Uncharacterized protein n=1 Tax=Candidatus Avisuccinivibrio stercorigallinarum TaxID=2840704 RepID=A0A9D9DBH6_9GAMM|nr:hypothetical protein [Candidatus Avisuccinivibrio stercorigallinarum]
MKRVFTGLAAAVLLAGTCVSAQAGLGDLLNNSTIEMVKKGVLTDYSDAVTVGNVLDRYSRCKPGTTKWENFESEQGRNIVEFSCSLVDEDRDALKSDSVVMSSISMLALTCIPADQAKQLSEAEVYAAAGSLAQKAVDFKDLQFDVQFSVSKVKEDSFSVQYVGFNTIYPDGTDSDIPLYHEDLRYIYDDISVFEGYVQDQDTDGFGEIMNDALKARMRACGDDFEEAAGL